MSSYSSPERSVSDINSKDDNLNEKSVELKYRVRICLQKYFSDERARCYVLVSKWRRVRWLEQRLRELFALRGPFCLLSRGHLLPSAESLAILHPDDPVEVVPNTDSTQICNVQNSDISKDIPGTITTLKPSQCEEVHEEDTDISYRDNNLNNVKMKALALLNEKYCDINGDYASKECKVFEENNQSANYPTEFPAQKRRRVRRRKRNSNAPINGDDTTEGSVERAVPADPVQRNRAASPRAPRIVRSIL
ncbi:unnamed protein product [Colias eurytheme]|nr:unnamed protein product [Colias eurytheme]